MWNFHARATVCAWPIGPFACLNLIAGLHFSFLSVFFLILLVTHGGRGGGEKVEEDAGFDGAGITGSYELPDMSAENQILLEPYLLLTGKPSPTALCCIR
jgi:hypothetical protein